MPTGIYKHPPQCGFQKGKRKWGKGEEHYNWKGKNIKYFGLHKWIRRELGNATRCDNRKDKILSFPCSRKSMTFQHAKLKGYRYVKNLKNFIQLCKSCHTKYDKKTKT